MKDHKRFTESLSYDYFEGAFPEHLEICIEALKGRVEELQLKEARVTADYGTVDYDYYNAPPDYSLEGWRPMTDKEIERAKIRSQKAKEAAAKKRANQKAKDIEKAKKLLEKHGMKVEET